MKHKASSNWNILRRFIWLEYKKWGRLLDAVPKSSLMFYFVIFLEILIIVFMRWYIPFLGGNPRGVVITILVFFLLVIFILSCLSFTIPASDGPELFPLNPFNFKVADLNVVSQISGRPLTWTLIGWFRTTLRVMGLIFVLSLFIFSYGSKFDIQLLYMLSAVFTLFLGTHLFILAGAFVYTFVEEILENFKPRWREENISGITTVVKALIFLLFFGGLVVIMEASKINTLFLEDLVLNLWFIPPFNIIYLILAFLSKTWPHDMVLLALSTLIFNWLVVNFLFFLILGRIDPLARLYERQPLVQYLSSNIEAPLISLLIFSSLAQILFKFTYVKSSQSRFLSEISSLLKKDFLLLDKFRISLLYSCAFILISGLLVFWIFTKVTIYPGYLIIVPVITIIISLFLWFKESKTFVRHFDISKTALITEKWLLSFLLVICIHIPLLIMNNNDLFLIGLCIYFLCFCFGIIYHNLKPSTA
ncbi:MAG: hypothetical protein ACFFB5_01885 [Promethearchaeota archaeon]